MMQKTLIALVVIAVLALGVWYVAQPRQIDSTSTVVPTTTTTNQEPKITAGIPTTSIAGNVKEIEPATTTAGKHPGMKLYRNEEFGFEFWYPEEWEARIPAFYSKVSLFNMEVGPGAPVAINITPKEWIEKALVKMKARGVVTKDVVLDGRVALEMEDQDDFSRPAIITLVLVDNKYWIDITGIKQDEEAYRAVLHTFTFLK